MASLYEQILAEAQAMTGLSSKTNVRHRDAIIALAKSGIAPTPPGPGAYLFADDFNGPAGAPPDPARWTVSNVDDTSPTVAQTSYVTANAFQDGAGNLVLRVSKGTRGRPYSGALLATFEYGSGWPPTGVKAAIAPPARIEARMKLPKGAGLWPSLWPLATNAPPGKVLEIDVMEARMFRPNENTFHTHNLQEYGSAVDAGVDLSAAFHVYAADYFPDRVDFLLDGRKVGSTPLPAWTPAQTVGPVLWNIVGPPDGWGGEGGPPPASALPADLLVDYVRAWRL